LSDGSVTRHLKLMTSLDANVECIEMTNIGRMDKDQLPSRGVNIGEGYEAVRRQVYLHLPDPLNRSYVYATSWWQEDAVDEYIRCVNGTL